MKLSQLEYATEVIINEINVYETFYGGTVRRIWAVDNSKHWAVIWEAAQMQCIYISRIFSVNVSV